MITDPYSSKDVVVGRTGELFESHGAFVEKYTCSKYRFMTIEQFKKDVVPTLESSEAEGKFFHYILRDLSKGRFFTVEPDGVHEFYVERAYQIYTEALIKEIKERENNKVNKPSLALDLNCSAQVVSYKEFTNSIELTLKIPSIKILFHHEIHEKLNIPIYLPPLLYKVQLNIQNNVPLRTFVYVLKEDSVLTKNIVIGDLALPNIYAESSNHQICTGTTRFREDVKFESMTPAMVASKAFELFLSSNFNFDLFMLERLPPNLLAEFKRRIVTCTEEQLAQIKDIFTSIPTSSSTKKTIDFDAWMKEENDQNSITQIFSRGHYLAMLIWCLNDKKGHERLQWKTTRCNPM